MKKSKNYETEFSVEWTTVWREFGLKNYIPLDPDYQKGLADLRDWLEENFQPPRRKSEKKSRISKAMDRISKFMSSEEGQKSVSDFIDERKRLKDITLSQIERFHKKFDSDQEFELFVNRIIQKYDSKEYRNRWFKRGIEPPEDLAWFLFRYASEYGRECSIEEWNEMANTFSSDLFYLRGFFFNKMDGQGSVIQIIKK